MASPVEDLIDAINDDDAARVAELVTGDPSLASSRDRNGVSAIMLSRYRFDRETTDALLAADPDLDVFEATALGYIDRLRERLAEDHWRATAYSTDGFTALHFAAFFGKVEAARTLLDAGAVVNAYSVNELQVQPLHSAAVRAPPRGLSRADRGRRRRQRDAAPRVHAAPRGGQARRCRARRAVPVGRGGSDGPDRSGRHPGRHRRGGRPRRRRASTTRGRRRATGR